MLQQATTARSVSSRANTDQEQLHEQPRWAPPPPPTGQDRALTISLAPVLPQPPQTAHHTHATDIVTIYYQYIFPSVQRLQQVPAGGSVSCKATAWLLPSPHQLSLLRPHTRLHSSTLPHTYTHAPNTVIIHHQHILPLAQTQQTMPVLMCVWVCRASGSDACADALPRTTATNMEALLLPGSTYLKYGVPLRVMTLLYHFYNKLVVGIIIMISKQTFLF